MLIGVLSSTSTFQPPDQFDVLTLGSAYGSTAVLDTCPRCILEMTRWETPAL